MNRFSGLKKGWVSLFFNRSAKRTKEEAMLFRRIESESNRACFGFGTPAEAEAVAKVLMLTKPYGLNTGCRRVGGAEEEIYVVAVCNNSDSDLSLHHWAEEQLRDFINSLGPAGLYPLEGPQSPA